MWLKTITTVHNAQDRLLFNMFKHIKAEQKRGKMIKKNNEGSYPMMHGYSKIGDICIK